MQRSKAVTLAVMLAALARLNICLHVSNARLDRAALLTWLPSTNAGAHNVEIVAKPDIVYIERSESGQHLNFDFLLDNETNNRLILSSVTVSVFDERDRLIRREFVNEYNRASLELSPRRVVEPATSTLIFNPFHSFAATVPLKRLRYVFAFRTEDGITRYRSDIVVNPVRYETKTQLILPVKGRVLVWDGHDYQSHHRRFDYTRPPFLQLGIRTNSHRYSYDFVVVNDQGLMHPADPSAGDEWYPGKSDTNEVYYGFGVPIYAAGNGRVAAIHDGQPDNRSFTQAELATRETARGGNYVIIDHLNGEYSWFTHLRQGSVRVRIGQEVKQGEIIAQMGASGDSLFPHLHYELRTGVGVKEVQGLPSYFTNFRRLLGAGPIVVKKGQVDTGDIVESLEPTGQEKSTSTSCGSGAALFILDGAKRVIVAGGTKACAHASHRSASPI
jgi:Peptidase family M23